MHSADGQTTLPTRELFDRYVLPTYGRFPLELARGEGSRVWDEQGREYLDFGAGIAVCSLGHAHPRITEAIRQQALTLGHTSNLYYTRPQGLLARRLTELVGTPGRCFFCNSGAEANEGLYKVARRFGNLGTPGNRHEIVTFEHSFHGRTLAGIAATGQEKVRLGFEPLMGGFTQARFNDLASVEAALTSRTAAILLEPIQGETGVQPARPEFLRELRRLCDERDILLMFDEVQCGLGRTGDWCGWRSLGAPEVEADAVSWAKGMAGSFPMGSFWVRDRAVAMPDGSQKKLGDLLGPGTHGTTFGGNPLGCAAALATLDVIEEEGLLAHAAEVGNFAREALAGLCSPLVREVRGVGLMLGIELDAGTIAACPPLTRPDRAPALLLVDQLQEAGLLVVPSGTHILRWLPALNVRREEVERAVGIVGEVFTALWAQAHRS